MQNVVATHGLLVRWSDRPFRVGNVLMGQPNGSYPGTCWRRTRKSEHRTLSIPAFQLQLHKNLYWPMVRWPRFDGSASIHKLSYQLLKRNPIMYVNGSCMMTLGEALTTHGMPPAYFDVSKIAREGWVLKSIWKNGYETQVMGLKATDGWIDVEAAFQHNNGYRTLANNGVYHKKHKWSRRSSQRMAGYIYNKDELVQVYLKSDSKLCKVRC